MIADLGSLVECLFFEHTLLYGGYDTPATLAWDVEHVGAELVLS